VREYRLLARYIVSYDLNGSNPTHATMDEHMASARWSYGRILEAVWFVGTYQSTEQVFDHVNLILSKNDQLLVVRCDEAVWRNLVASDDELMAAWAANA
jgi:hypothetical protein